MMPGMFIMCCMAVNLFVWLVVLLVRRGYLMTLLVVEMLMMRMSFMLFVVHKSMFEQKYFFTYGALLQISVELLQIFDLLSQMPNK
jgi:hypothetical protein